MRSKTFRPHEVVALYEQGEVASFEGVIGKISHEDRGSTLGSSAGTFT